MLLSLGQKLYSLLLYHILRHRKAWGIFLYIFQCFFSPIKLAQMSLKKICQILPKMQSRQQHHQKLQKVSEKYAQIAAPHSQNQAFRLRRVAKIINPRVPPKVAKNIPKLLPKGYKQKLKRALLGSISEVTF